MAPLPQAGEGRDYAMPTYDYVCDACGHEFELFQSIKDAPKKKCPDCGKSKLRRLIGPGAAIVFKGSGFYKTDYRSESYKKAAAADKPKTETPKSETKKSDVEKPKGEGKGKTDSSSLKLD
jgi:putative FmdB family regulatory protein